MPQKKETLYIDTSIPSAYYDLREPEKMATTRQFWKEAKKYKLYVSNITVIELDADKGEKRIQYRELIKDIPRLELTSEVERVAGLYLEAKIIPLRFRIDALHIGVATVYRIDYLVTWNCRHIAGAHKRKQIREFGLKKGLFLPEIVIPTEIIEEV